MKQINVAVIGTGWCGGIRAETAHKNPLVKDLYIAETNEIRLKEMADKVTIVRLNADENKTLISQLKIDELPTLFIYKNNEIIWKHSGFISEEDLTKQLQ
jgi:hypothetical protein